MVMIKVYQTYLINLFENIAKCIFSVFSLIIILNIFEEVSFFKDVEINPLYPFS